VKLFGMNIFGRKKLPGANKNNHFYLRDASREGLQQPVHIHFDSYEPSLLMGKKILPNPCTFLVTIDSSEFSPRGHTCRVAGINHKLSAQGVIDGVVAHVNMARYQDDGSIQRVYVELLEDGRVVGKLITGEGCEEITNLSGVSFMVGDTIFLDGMGEPFDSNNQPGATKAQKLFLEQERERAQEEMVNSLFDS
jgi:hypothetical protein